MVTNEPVAPSGALKVGHACRFVREQSLELRQRARKRQIASLKYVDSHGRPTLAQTQNILPVVGGCDNRISTVRCSRSVMADRSCCQLRSDTFLKTKYALEEKGVPRRYANPHWHKSCQGTSAILLILLTKL